MTRAAAWRAALRVGPDDPPRPLSAVVALAVAVQDGLFDEVPDAADRVQKVLSDVPETDVDATLALSDADRKKFAAAAAAAVG